MHETSIALSILAAVEDVFRSTPGARRVEKIRIRVGMLSLVDPEALRFALSVVSRDTPAENAEVEIETVRPRFRCPHCGYEWEVGDEDVKRIADDPMLATLVHIHPDVVVKYLRCPRCGSTDVEIVEGKGVVLHSVVIETDEEKG
ncbi:hydrogenase maturation nickel metallochaperone HypA [Hyperthermus butylicus]|uniref:Hydrogenase maturation factor HypA n=1 Tax=Hyperthermus butylicus (strain DSM 5456 / JCM 9403 / PLM1-5) TaxID=415426 RepID=A2BJM6_HYPBU|nr:hydrogenase maturation nickel metallochaperone HypA [Hyperthermus butylicus]ABM80187.1 hydrogenase expression/synthesis hypA family [Hyperthermus butylicus DSM 5456]